MRDEILGQLQAALPVDVVILGLHGAMVAHGYDDLRRRHARARAGHRRARCVDRRRARPALPSHAQARRNADILVLFKEFPHTDFADRAEEVVDLVLRDRSAARSGRSCRSTIAADRELPTTLQPMRGFVDRIKALEGKDGVLSVSIVHGFPYADVPEIGAEILVVTDGDKAKADALATELGEEFVACAARRSRDHSTPTRRSTRRSPSTAGRW